MFEHHKSPLLPRREFFGRLARTTGIGLLVLAGALGMGMVGYRCLEHLSWIDSFANAAMILSGMGPLTPLKEESSKIFAGGYALFSGLAFITTVGFILGPIAHRFLHKFHLETTARDRRSDAEKAGRESK
jgi:hypothetical protein